MSLIAQLKELKTIFDQAEPDILFRLGHKEEDILSVTSAEQVTGKNGMHKDGHQSEHDILSVYVEHALGEDVYELDEDGWSEELERVKASFSHYDPRYAENFDSNLVWQDTDEGHLGAGLYWNGVCCESSLRALADYVNERSWGGDDDAVFIFSGIYIDTGTDCTVAEPQTVLKKLNRHILENDSLIAVIDDLAEGEDITVNGEAI